MPADGCYQVWETRDGGASVSLLSGSPFDPSSTDGITSSSDCYDPAVSDDGAFVALRCKKKMHPSGYAPGSYGVDEGWLYDRAADRLHLIAPITPSDDAKCASSATAKTALRTALQQYWSDSTPVSSDWNFTAYGITTATSSSCNFAAAAGLQSGVNTIGVGAGQPSMDAAGRFVVYTTNFRKHSPLACTKEQDTVLHLQIPAAVPAPSLATLTRAGRFA